MFKTTIMQIQKILPYTLRRYLQVVSKVFQVPMFVWVLVS